MKSLATVILPNGFTLAVTTLTNLEADLKIALLLISIVYTCWRFRRDFRRDRKRNAARDHASDTRDVYGSRD